MRFEVQKNLTFAFMDSFSQSGPNLNDDVQQGYWINETEKLWNKATGRNESFDFKTIDEMRFLRRMQNVRRKKIVFTISMMRRSRG